MEQNGFTHRITNIYPKFSAPSVVDLTKGYFQLVFDYVPLEEQSEEQEEPDIIPNQIASILQKLFAIS